MSIRITFESQISEDTNKSFSFEYGHINELPAKLQ